MRKRKLFLLLLAPVAIVIWYTKHQDSHKAPAGPPFAKLDSLLDTYLKSGWSVLVPPKREGPYRMIQGEHRFVPRNAPEKGLAFRIKDAGGTEEVRVDSSTEYDQMLIELETPDGHRTMVVLKRTE